MAITAARNDIRNYFIPRGIVQWGPYINGRYEGQIDMGEAENATMTVKPTMFEMDSARSGIAVLAVSEPVKIEVSAKLKVNNVTLANLAQFVIGDLSSLVQTAQAVTDEAIYCPSAGRIHQLGRSASNPVGVQGVSVLTLKSKSGADADTYETGAYHVGDLVKPTVSNGYFYRVKTAGTPLAEPTWGTTIGGTTTAVAVFTCVGKITLSAGVDYEVDLPSGEFSPLANGSFAETLVMADATTDDKTLLATYTPVASTRPRIAGPKVKSQYGSLMIKGDPALGITNTWYIPFASITPSGDLPVITSDTKAVSLDFEVKAMRHPDSAYGNDFLFIDSQPVAG